jgi:hypothetical protein
MATVRPGFWMLTRNVLPSGAKVGPQNSPSLVRLLANA